MIKDSVTIVVRDNKGKYLGVSRKNNYTLFGLAGGKIEDSETPEEAAYRELKEETGLEAISLKQIVVRERYGELVYCFEAETIGEMHSNEYLISIGEGTLKWVTYKELCDGPFGDYNELVLGEAYEWNKDSN